MKQFFSTQWHTNKQAIFLIATAVLFLAAAVQYAFGLTYVLSLTPIFLAVIMAVSLLFWDISAKHKALLAAGVILAGFVIELIGVKTGLLFGDYSYGTVMGFTLWGVPATIGITWFIVTVSAWHIVNFGALMLLQRFLLGGILVVMFDLVLEQFAVTYGLWSWQGAKIPLSNYGTWFVVSQLFLLAYYLVDKKRIASLYSAGLLPLMALFFWLMLLIHG